MILLYQKMCTARFLPWAFLIFISKSWSLSSAECPTTVSQLEDINVQDLHYDVNIFTGDLSQTKPEVSSESTVFFSVRSNNGSLVTAINCSLHFPLDVRPIHFLEPFYSIKKRNSSSVSGSLFYNSGKPFPLLTPNALFTVGPKKLYSMKATFSVSVAVPPSSNYTVLSNMPLERSELDKAGQWHRFERTPPLWHNQVLVTVLDGKDFHVAQYKDDERNRTVSVYWDPTDDQKGAPSSEKDTRCTAEYIGRLLTHFEKRFHERIPLPKLDLVVTPDWGVFQTLEQHIKNTGFLYSQFGGKTCEKPSFGASDRWKWFESLMNQWFGYLAADTDGSSSPYAYLKGRLVSYFLKEAENVLPPGVIDSTPSTKTFEQEVIGMLESVLTKPVFDHGLLENFMGKLKQTESRLAMEDLPVILQQSVETFNKTHLLPSVATVPILLRNWLNSSISSFDFPQIHVEQRGARSNGVFINQKHPNDYLRWLPLEIVTDSERIFTWMPPVRESVSVALSESVNGPKFVFINPNITGNFHVDYDPNLMQLISTQLVHHLDTIPSLGRAKILSDHVQLLKIQHTSIESIVKLLKYFEYENDPLVWNTFTKEIIHHREKSYLEIYGTKNFKLQKFLGSIIDKALARYGIPSVDALLLSANDTDESTIPSREIMKACIRTSSPSCIRLAKNLLLSWKANPNLNNPFKRFHSGRKFECLGLRGTQPSDAVFQFFLDKDERINRFCVALWCTGNDTLIMDNAKRAFENGSWVPNEMQCSSPLYGFLFNSDIPSDFSQLIEPVYWMMKNTIFEGKLLNPSIPPRPWAFSDQDESDDHLQVKRFLEDISFTDDAVFSDLDNLLDEYKKLYNGTDEELDGDEYHAVTNGMWYAKQNRRRYAVTEKYAEPLNLALEKEGV